MGGRSFSRRQESRSPQTAGNPSKEALFAMRTRYVVLRRCGGALRAATSYGECRKNHAASAGGYVVDGCMEFMAGGEDGLKCAACGCHRSFHRRVMPYDQGFGCERCPSPARRQ
ncbi:hypothetical protein HPP92_012638 [Vanilla planifolia]|uniref:ZF-HD dimerization-type domain-containing protein n=1 Tax=Vanilla planifolia TaxID=51239 RepID=A0A835QSI2_VANPL|nr:hypothetical protein HPP92_012638 [Vanilla planifolia]